MLHRIKRTSDWIAAFVLIILVAVAFMIGINRLQDPSIWLDEARTAEIAQQKTYGDVVKKALALRPYPPLYFLIVHDFLTFRNDEFGLRLPSVLFGSLLMAAVFLLGRALYGNLIGLVSAVLTLSSFQFFFHLRDANCYTVLAFFTTMSTYLFWKAMNQPGKTNWFLYLLFALFSIQTHHVGMIFILSQLMIGLGFIAADQLGIGKKFSPIDPTIPAEGNILSRWEGQKSESLFGFRRNRNFSVAAIGILLFVFLWLLFYKHMGGVRVSAFSGFSISKLWACVFSASTFRLIKTSYFAYTPSWYVLALQLMGLLTVLRFERRRGLFLLWHILVPAAVIFISLSVTAPVGASRYTFLLFPLLNILCACTLKAGNCVPRKLRLGPVFRYLILGAVLTVMFLHIRVPLRATPFVLRHPGIENWRRTAEILTTEGNKGDVAFICAGFTVNALNYYYHGPIHRIEVERGTADEAKLREAVIPHIRDKKRIWLILSHEEKDEKITYFLDRLNLSFVRENGLRIQIQTARLAEQSLTGIRIILFAIAPARTIARHKP